MKAVKDKPKVMAKRLKVRDRMRRASSHLSIILDTNYRSVDALRKAVMAWQAGELQEAERDVQDVIAGRKTTSMMGSM